MLSFLRLLRAFFVRDYSIQTSYRLAFLINIGSVFFSTFTYYFVSRLINEESAQLPAQYEGNYFAFVLIGIAFSSYFNVGLRSFATALRSAQTFGTLEAMLMTPASLPSLIIGSATWAYAFTSFRVLIHLILGARLGIDLSNANYGAALLVMLLSIVAFASVGIIAASVVTVIKQGDPVTLLFGSIANLIGGVLFPITVMPAWLQQIAKLLPITYALEGMREALLFGADWLALRSELIALTIFCIIFAPLSLLVFRLAINRARAEGTLTHY